jgi:ADP-ribosylglycohydrolase
MTLPDSRDTNQKCKAALWGLYIGDALAMPVHWYYNRDSLYEDYGGVTGYLAPKNPHPGSILFRSSYTAPGPKGEILHDQAPYWGREGTHFHYHQFLKAGENTLNLKLCSLLIHSLNDRGGYDAEDYLGRYIAFMTTPGTHRDTYIEECHRNFFINYAKGVPPRQCGTVEKHIGGLPGIVPIVVYHHAQPDRARQAALEHLALTHPGEKMRSAGALLIELLISVLAGERLAAAIRRMLHEQKYPFVGHPFEKLLADPDDWVIGPRFSTACYVEHSVPAVLYLALKYSNEPEKALVANTNIGGDNAYRGAVLGALLGAEKGLEAFPRRWIKGLLNPPPEIPPSVV